MTAPSVSVDWLALSRTGGGASGRSRHEPEHDPKQIGTAENIGMRKLLKAPVVADLLGISQRKLWQLTNCGDIPSVRIGRNLRYDEADIAEWIERNKRRGTRE